MAKKSVGTTLSRMFSRLACTRIVREWLSVGNGVPCSSTSCSMAITLNNSVICREALESCTLSPTCSDASRAYVIGANYRVASCAGLSDS